MILGIFRVSLLCSVCLVMPWWAQIQEIHGRAWKLFCNICSSPSNIFLRCSLCVVCWETQKRDNKYHTFSIKYLSTILWALQITLCNWCFWILELFRKTDHFKCHRNHPEMTMATRKRQNFSHICVCMCMCVRVGAKSVAWISEVREKGVAETRNGSASCPSSQSLRGSWSARWHPPRSESERSEEMVDPMLSIRIRSISWDPCSCSSLLFRNLCSRSRFSSWCWLLLSVSSSFWHDQIRLSKSFILFSFPPTSTVQPPALLRRSQVPEGFKLQKSSETSCFPVPRSCAASSQLFPFPSSDKSHMLVSKGFEDSLSRGNYRMCSVLWVILPELSPLHYHICPQRGLESLTQTSPALQLSHQNVPWELCSLLHGLAGFLRNSFLFSKWFT